MVGQVQVVSILMIVQGALAMVMGFFYVAGGLINVAGVANSRGGRSEDETIAMIVMSILVLLGFGMLLVGALNIFGAIRAMSFRSRTFAIFALFSNILGVFTCYCTPTSLGVMIYGLIVMFNREVAQAFELASQGESKQSILERFTRRPM
jgi:hypothetical protein